MLWSHCSFLIALSLTQTHPPTPLSHHMTPISRTMIYAEPFLAAAAFFAAICASVWWASLPTFFAAAAFFAFSVY